MGQYDAFIWVGGALVAGYFIITNPDIFSNIFPPAGGSSDPPIDDDGGSDEEEEEGESSDGTTDCKKACANCWCKTYSEKCSGSCSRCNGGNRVMSKCGGSSEASQKETNSGEFGSGSTTPSCKELCDKGWCESYNSKGCTGGCSKCSGGGTSINIGSSTCASKVISSNCAGDCKQTCWRGKVGTQIYTSCVSQAIGNCSSVSCGPCKAARDKFCKNHGPCTSNLAYAMRTDIYPYGEIFPSNVYS